MYMSIAILFIIIKNWKLLKWPSTGERINYGVSMQWNNTRQEKGERYG